MNEIRNALNAGKEVITHTDAVSVPGWSGAGYIITDPVTGDGAYKIAGGGNGSFIQFIIDNFGYILSVLSVVIGTLSVFLADILYGLFSVVTSCSNAIAKMILNDNWLAGGVLFTIVSAISVAFLVTSVYLFVIASEVATFSAVVTTGALSLSLGFLFSNIGSECEKI